MNPDILYPILTFYQNKPIDFEDIACTNLEKEQN